jgi:hypothetical protein
MVIKNFLFGGRPQNDSIDAIKRRIFLVATPVACLSMLIVWGIGLGQTNLSSWDVFSLPFFAFLFLILVALFWRQVIHLRTFELIAYAMALALAFSEMVAIFLRIILTNGPFSPNFTLWLPFVYILGFLILSTNKALLFSTLYFFSTLILGIGVYMHFLLYGLPFPNISLLVEVYFASAFYITVLYLFSQNKRALRIETCGCRRYVKAGHDRLAHPGG